MVQYVAKTAPRPHFIIIPCLCDVRVCILDLSDDMEYPYAISNHFYGVVLGHALLYIQEVA